MTMKPNPPGRPEDEPKTASAMAWDASGWPAFSITPFSALMNQGFDLSRSLFEIALGSSEITTDQRDWRFQDPAWQSNPFYRRLSQAYIAVSEAVEKLIPDDLPMESKIRAQLVAAIVTSAMAPTNTLLGNPAAIAKTMQSGGSNLAKGFMSFLSDMTENGGLPRQVDDSDFEVGRNLAITPGDVVARTEMFELIEYRSATDTVSAVPVLLVPPQIGRYYFTDLAPGRSFAEYTVGQGFRYFALSWKNPSADDRDWSLADYVSAVLDACRIVSEIARRPSLNLVGFCAGGIMAAIASSILAGREDLAVNSLTLCVTMLNFKVDAALGAFRFPALLSMAKAQSAMKGILPGTELHKVFSWLRPNDLIWNYWVNNYLMGETPPAFDILAWNKDSTNMAGTLHKDFLDLFEANEIATSRNFEILGQTIDLSTVKCDHFVVGAVTDHLTPWKACYQSGKVLGGEGTFALSNGGHVAALVNPPSNPKAYHFLGPSNSEDADGWMAEAKKESGSWWQAWTAWCRDRSGPMIKAPRQAGSKKYRPITDAPGRYVRE